MRIAWASQSNRSFRLVAVVLVAIALVIAAGIAVSPTVNRALHMERIYPGVQVAGIDLSGQTIGEAEVTIQAGLRPYAATALAIKAGDRDLTLTAAELGFRPRESELAQTAFAEGRDRGALGFIGRVISGQVLGPARTVESSLVDEQAVDAAVAQIAGQVYRAPVEAELTLKPEVKLKPSALGQTLDQESARSIIWQQLVTMKADPIALPTTAPAPKVSTADLQTIHDQATAILARGLVFTPSSPVESRGWTVPKTMLQDSLVLKTEPFALDVQPDVFATIVAGAAKDVYRDPTSATLAIKDGKVILTPETLGLVVDQKATLAKARDSVLASANTSSLVASAIPAKVTAADLKPTADEAEAIIAKGLSLTIGGKVGGDGNLAVNRTFTATPTELGNLLTLTPGADGKLTIGINAESIGQLVDRINKEYQYPSLAARFATWSGGRLNVQVGKEIAAIVIDRNKAVAEITAKWREGKVNLVTDLGKMKVDQAFADRLKADIKGVIRERSIYFGDASPERAHNIRLALSRINGTLVAPGEIYSFNISTGPTTIEAGYTWGFAYEKDKRTGQNVVVPSEAGGICQVATTVFQPVFLAGYQIEERSWHMFNIASYSVSGYLGLDATVYPPYSDFKFLNNTDQYLMIVSGTRGSSTYVGLVGTKPNWTVSIGKEQITNVKAPPAQAIRSESSLFAKGRVITLKRPTNGFTSTITRTVTTPDGTKRTLTLKSIYQPSPLQVLVGTG